ncbi:MAG: Cof-type HAD-IIB family hydrolase [Brevinema sp.]
MKIRKKILDGLLKNFDASKIKAVAIDIDGTLINHEGTCTSRTIKAIEKLIKSGREVFLVTGRGVCTSHPIAKEVHIPKYMINYNGAVIWDIVDEKREYELCINQDTSNEIIKIVREEKLFTVLYSDDKYYYEVDCDEAKSLVERVKIEGYLKNFDLIDNTTFQKFLVSGSEENINNLENRLKKEHDDHINMIQTTPGMHKENDQYHTCLEIMHKKANKGTTLTKLLTMLNISTEETVAFGDDKNDIEMLKDVKWGIAMGNARPAVREVTPYTTLTNDEDGVAYFIEKYILEEDV